MHYDIIVIGGGISGIITAIALAKEGLKIALVELKSIETLTSLQDDGRVFAISQGSWQILSKYGLSDILAPKAGLIEHIRVCDDNSLLHLDFFNDVVDNLPLGYMLEHNNFVKEMYNIAISQKNITIYDGNAYDNIEFFPNHASVKIKEQVITADLIIGADGKNSKIRTLANIETSSWGYNQTAMVCNVTHEQNHQNIAIEKFMPNGPLAILPMAGGMTSSIVWIEKSELASIYLKMEPEEFLYYLQERFTDYLGPIKIVNNIYSYELSCKYAKKFYSHRLALIADAAHSIHPIAGQGLNLGISDIDCLVENIKSYRLNGLDIGGRIMLEKYHKKRFSAVMVMVAATDGINRLFVNNLAIIKIARRVGMASINKFGWLKKKITKYAMGD